MPIATTLFSSYKSAGFALSGGDLVATSSAGATVATNRPFNGKHYAEFTITTLTGTPVVGIATPTYSYGTQLLGVDNNGLGYRSGGAVVLNNVTLATIMTYVAGDRIGMAIDPANRLIWFRKNGGNWNNSGTANPTTGAEGIDYSTMALGRLMAAVGASASGTVWTCKFSTAFTDAAPTDYASIDNVQATKFQSTPLNILDPSQAVSLGPEVRCGSMPTAPMARAFMPAGPITVVSGEVQENAVPIGGKRVDVYDRNTGELIGFDISAGDGTWSVAALGRPSVRIVGSDPTAFNSLVYDNVIPL